MGMYRHWLCAGLLLSVAAAAWNPTGGPIDNQYTLKFLDLARHVSPPLCSAAALRSPLPLLPYAAVESTAHSPLHLAAALELDAPPCAHGRT